MVDGGPWKAEAGSTIGHRPSKTFDLNGIKDMTELQKTSVFVAVALLLTGAAVARLPGRATSDKVFGDQGQPFFPDFADPNSATSMEVIEYDSATGSPQPFQVMLKDKGWVIPSHHDYPADAKDRLKNTAVGVIDLKKDAIRSVKREDHKALGVLDPLDPKVAGSEGVGKRVILRDRTQKVLADFIIGKEVPNHPDQRYVRVPDQKQTYSVNVKVDLSTRFSDWIETNLLKLDKGRLRRLAFDNHKVDPEQGTIQAGEVFSIARKDASAPWTMEPPPPPDQEVNTEKVTTLTTSLGDLKIAGVRPMPEGAARDLRALKEGGTLTPTSRQSLQSLMSKGFYPTRKGLVSNQGDVRVGTDEGVVYTLRFGEVTFATGEDLTAGKKEEKGPGKDKGKDASEEKKSTGGIESRYLLVTVDFDPALIPEPAPEPTAAPTKLPDDVFQPEPGSAAARELEKAAQDRATRLKAETDRKIADGRKRAAELSERFLAWYYVVPGDNFRDIVLDRAALLRKKSDKPETPASTPSIPGFGGPSFPGLPPGHP